MWNDLRVKYNLVGKVYQCGQRRDLSYGYVYNAKASGTNYLLLSNPTGFLLTADGLSADHIAYSSRYLDPRHDSKVNGGFADGHVSTLSLPDATKAMRPILMSLPEKSAKSAK
jgi:prepilin-type processing-associated H-X9-DG protein